MSMIAVSIDGYVFSADILTISPHAASLLQQFNIDFLRQQQRIVDSERLASFYNQVVPVSDLDNYLKDPTSPMSNVTAFAAKFIRDELEASRSYTVIAKSATKIVLRRSRRESPQGIPLDLIQTTTRPDRAVFLVDIDGKFYLRCTCATFTTYGLPCRSV